MGLLGHILSIRAGVPYAQLVKDRILSVLGMDNTGIAMNTTAITLSDALKSRLAKSHIGGKEITFEPVLIIILKAQGHYIQLRMTC